MGPSRIQQQDMHEPSIPSAEPSATTLPAAPPLRPSQLPARVGVLALLWWVVAGGTAASWIVGIPAIVAAALLARPAPDAGWRLSLPGALRFTTFFLRESLRGGVDVARRVSAPRPRIAPGLLHYHWRLPSGSPARALFALCAGLLPGTLVANVSEQALLIHALDMGAPVGDDLAALEQRVAGLFSLELSAPEPGHG